MIDPKNNDPVSPKNTFLSLLKLNAKNPIRAPIIIGKKRNILESAIRIIPPATKKNFIDKNEASPSSPSIKFNAFTTTTKTKRETKTPSQYGNSNTPKTP
jgi:hypothetical protein